MYPTIRVQQGEVKPIEFHLQSWSANEQNMVDFDLTNYTVGFYIYASGSEDALVEFASCDVTDAESGKGYYTFNSILLDPGMYVIKYEARYDEEIERFPQYGSYNLFLTDPSM